MAEPADCLTGESSLGWLPTGSYPPLRVYSLLGPSWVPFSNSWFLTSLSSLVSRLLLLSYSYSICPSLCSPYVPATPQTVLQSSFCPWPPISKALSLNPRMQNSMLESEPRVLSLITCTCCSILKPLNFRICPWPLSLKLCSWRTHSAQCFTLTPSLPLSTTHSGLYHAHGLNPLLPTHEKIMWSK